MNFSEALELLKQRKSLYRKNWLEGGFYDRMEIRINDAELIETLKYGHDEDLYESIMSRVPWDDIFADDWEVVDE